MQFRKHNISQMCIIRIKSKEKCIDYNLSGLAFWCHKTYKVKKKETRTYRDNNLEDLVETEKN